MHILRTVGLVQRFDFGDGVARFELVKPGENLVELDLTSTRGLSEPLVVRRLVLFASYH